MGKTFDSLLNKGIKSTLRNVSCPKLVGLIQIFCSTGGVRK